MQNQETCNKCQCYWCINTCMECGQKNCVDTVKNCNKFKFKGLESDTNC